jgi:PAS domain S-box-containing protein
MPALKYLLSALTIAAAAGLFVFRRKSQVGRAGLLALAIGLALSALVWTAVSAQLFRSPLLETSLSLAITLALPILVLAFIFESTGQRNRLTPANLLLLALFPALVQAFLWTEPLHGWFFSPTASVLPPAIPPLQLLGWANVLFIAGLLLAALVFLILALIQLPGLCQPGAASLLASALVLTVAADLSGLGAGRVGADLGLMLASYVLLSPALLYFAINNRLVRLPSISRSEVLEGFSDGVIVLDKQNRIIDLNPAAEKVIGVTRRAAFGAPVENVLSNWSSLIQNTDARELEFRGSVNFNQEWRYYDVHLSSLQNRRGEETGKLVVFRDITEKRKTSDSGQQARDEMFILLHTIFGAASQAQSTKDFLNDAMFQIVYSFRSQDGLIYLFETSSNDLVSPTLSLSARHGPLTYNKRFLSTLQESNSIVPWIMVNKLPLLIPNARTDLRFSFLANQIEALSLGVFPMIHDQRVLGILVLARSQDAPFNADEITRLTVVAEELGTFIHSDRQRKMNIAMAERQRLVRDLHDSITQKLYGLVTLTEAVQIGMESGALDKIADMITRIGDNARQALREMRLFLHELKPVDLEREGLVSVLHQRLASVEGHSDIRASLVASQKISLPVEKEVALYFIAQESLNNILRHARAKSVQIKLRRRKNNVIFEIIDDGCGFDPGGVNGGGLGLKNIRERASQIGAALEIASARGKGTRISLSIPVNNL